MKKSGRSDDIHETPDVSHIQNPDVSHERSDVNIKSILIFAAGLVGLAVAVHLLILVMYRTLDAREAKEEGQPAPMALTGKEHIPPEPRLQAAPGFGVEVDKNNRDAVEKMGYKIDENGRADLSRKEPQAEMKVVRQQWEQELKGGADRQTGQPRMPIEQAMQMLVQQGVPTRQAGQGAQGSQPTDGHSSADIPSFWSAGQQMEKREQ